MGHRVYLSKIEKNISYSIFESNNNLPLFWIFLLPIFLLDEKSILKDREHLIEVFNDEQEESYDYDFCLQISSETIKINIDRSLGYLNKLNSNLESHFKQFALFMLDICKESLIEFDIMHLANFTSPEQFLDDLCVTLRQIDIGEMIREVQYYEEHEPNFYELVGYECLEKGDCHFLDFSKQYKNFIEQDFKYKKSYSKKYEYKVGIRYMLYDVLFPMIIGIIFIVVGIMMIINNERLFLAIIEILFGAFAVFYGYANINFKK